MYLVTGFGDPAATLSAALALALAFLLVSRKLCALWLTSLAACGLVIGLAKVVLYAHHALTGRLLPDALPNSPSGHVAGSALVYGAVALSYAGRWRDALAPAVLVLVLVIAFSRVYLGFHSDSDVLTGCAVGALCLAWFLRGMRREHVAPPAWPVVLAILPCFLVAGLGWRLPIDQALRYLAGQLAVEFR